MGLKYILRCDEADTTFNEEENTFRHLYGIEVKLRKHGNSDSSLALRYFINKLCNCNFIYKNDQWIFVMNTFQNNFLRLHMISGLLQNF